MMTMGALGNHPQADTAPPPKTTPRAWRWLGWALAAPFVFVFGGPGLVVLMVVSLGYLAVISVLDLPLLYVMATVAGTAYCRTMIGRTGAPEIRAAAKLSPIA